MQWVKRLSKICLKGSASMRGANSPWRTYNPNGHKINADVAAARREWTSENSLIRMRRKRFGENDYKPGLDTLIKRGRYKSVPKDND